MIFVLNGETLQLKGLILDTASGILLFTSYETSALGYGKHF